MSPLPGPGSSSTAALRTLPRRVWFTMVQVMRKLRFVLPCIRPARAARKAFSLAMVLVLPGGAQNIPHGSVPQPLGQRAGDSLGQLDPSNQSQEEERFRALNRQRQKNIVSDTNKLLKLAGELDMETKGAGIDSFTPEQLRKWAEIEKLAHSVKDKMSYSFRAPSVFQQTLPIQTRQNRLP